MDALNQKVIEAEQQLRDVLASLGIPEQAWIAIRAAASTLVKAKVEQDTRELVAVFKEALNG